MNMGALGLLKYIGVMMLKNIMMKMVLDALFDRVILALKRQAQKSSSSIDNKVVELFVENRAEITRDIKSRL
jgi:hypothetical protein